jgi:hypothetical protein
MLICLFYVLWFLRSFAQAWDQVMGVKYYGLVRHASNDHHLLSRVWYVSRPSVYGTQVDHMYILICPLSVGCGDWVVHVLWTRTLQRLLSPRVWFTVSKP